MDLAGRCFHVRRPSDILRGTASILASDTPMPNMMFPVPDVKTARPKGMTRTRHPSDQSLYRGKQLQISRLVGIFAPHDHAERVAAQGPTPSRMWYRASVTVIDDILDGAEASVKVGRDPGVGGDKSDDDEDVGLRLTIGGTLVGVAGSENVRRVWDRFRLISRLHAGWGSCSSER